MHIRHASTRVGRARSRPVRTLIPALLLAVSAPVLAVKPPAGHRESGEARVHAELTLEQAVARVQAKTHGKVLGADEQRRGTIIEYRIKVLTPNGHVRVVPVRTRATKAENDKETR